MARLLRHVLYDERLTMPSQQIDVGCDSLVHDYINRKPTDIINGQWRTRRIKIGNGIDLWYELFLFDITGKWNHDTLTFDTKQQLDNFAKICRIKLIESSYY